MKLDEPGFPVPRLSRQMCDGDHSPGPRGAPHKERIRESVHHVPAQIESLGRILLELSNSGCVLSVLHGRAQCIEEFGAQARSLRIIPSNSELELDGSILEELERVSDLGSSEGGPELRPSPLSWPRRARVFRVARRRDGPKLVGPLQGLRRVRKALRRSRPDLRDRA